jgi:DDE superfamily endonuclease
MPSDEDVTQRARSLQAMTGLTAQEFTGLLPHFEHALAAYLLCFLSDTMEGKEHDKSLADLAGYTLPRGSHLYQDMGSQGFMLGGITMIQPKKKPRGGELTPPEKAHNRVISSIRIRIEHAIGGVKRYRMMKDKMRLLQDRIRATIMKTCRWLHSFRLQYRPWNYANQ